MNYLFLYVNVHNENQEISKFHINDKFLIHKLFSLAFLNIFQHSHWIISFISSYPQVRTGPKVNIKSNSKRFAFLSNNSLHNYHHIFTKGLSYFLLESDRSAALVSLRFLVALPFLPSPPKEADQWCRTVLLLLADTSSPSCLYTALVTSRLTTLGWNFICVGVKYLWLHFLDC